ncbi:MAG: hypothetical protein WA628_04115 [Terriglobales bacterium]
MYHPLSLKIEFGPRSKAVDGVEGQFVSQNADDSVVIRADAIQKLLHSANQRITTTNAPELGHHL